MQKEERSVITVRLNKSLKLQLEMLAVKDNRTLNSLITHILYQYVLDAKK